MGLKREIRLRMIDMGDEVDITWISYHYNHSPIASDDAGDKDTHIFVNRYPPLHPSFSFSAVLLC